MRQFWFAQLTKYQKIVLFIAWLGWVFDIADTALFNFAKSPMMQDMMGQAAYKLHGTEKEGLIQTVFLLGWSLGGLIFGILADKLGRTKVLVATIALYCAFTGLTALCQTPEQVLIVRFLTGLGIGGEWAAGAALVAETLPNEARAKAAAFLQTAAAVGPILAATANFAMAHISWRWLFALGVLPAILALFVRLKVNHDQPISTEISAPINPVKNLFADPLLRKLSLLVVVLGFVGIAGAGNVSFWLPNLVAGVSKGMDSALIRERTSYATYTLHIGTIAGVLVFPILCERLGRRGAFGLFFAFCPVVLGLVSASRNFNTLLAVAPLLSFFAIGLTAGYALYFPELFPQKVRATGAGLGYNTGRILSAPMPLITAQIIQNVGSASSGLLIAGAIYVVGLIVLPMMPETLGKVLER